SCALPTPGLRRRTRAPAPARPGAIGGSRGPTPPRPAATAPGKARPSTETAGPHSTRRQLPATHLAGPVPLGEAGRLLDAGRDRRHRLGPGRRARPRLHHAPP